MQKEVPMDRAAVLATELEILHALCNGGGTRQQRTELVHTLDDHVFFEPEHQVVFESVRALLTRGLFSSESLAVHLNNRGFPDTDLDKYLVASAPNIRDALVQARELCSLKG